MYPVNIEQYKDIFHNSYSILRVLSGSQAVVSNKWYAKQKLLLQV